MEIKHKMSPEFVNDINSGLILFLLKYSKGFNPIDVEGKDYLAFITLITYAMNRIIKARIIIANI